MEDRLWGHRGRARWQPPKLGARPGQMVPQTRTRPPTPWWKELLPWAVTTPVHCHAWGRPGVCVGERTDEERRDTGV